MKEFVAGPKGQKLINLGFFAISLLPVMLFCFIMAQRIALPFDLEWGEGAGINQINRLLSGDPIYAAPSLEYVALVYTPFYYLLSAVISRVVMPVALAARLLSVLATLGTVGIIFWLVTRETKNFLAAWLAGALYLACFGLSDGFFDLVRVDSLYVFLLMSSLMLIRTTSTTLGRVMTGLMISVGVLTKQSTIIVFLPLMAYLVIRSWRLSWPLLMSTVMGIGLSFLWINSLSGGWFAYYILRLPVEHGYSLISAVDFWVGDFLGPLGIAVGFGIFYFISNFKTSEDHKAGGDGEKGERDGKETWIWNLPHHVVIYGFFLAGAIAAAWMTRATNGGGANNVMSAYAATALVFGLGLDEAEQLVSNAKRSWRLLEIFLPCLVAVQIAGLIYNPFGYIPTKLEIEANQELVAEMSGVEGPVFIPYRSQLPALAGKPALIHAVNLFELTGYFHGDMLPEGMELIETIRKGICHQSFGMIVLDQPVPWFREQIASAYQINDKLSLPDDTKRSDQLHWQGGFESVYYPLDFYSLENCLSTISK